MSTQEQVYDWDSPMENESGEDFQVLPDGSEAEFEVMAFERGFSNAKNAPMAKYQIKVWNEHGQARVFENIILHSNFAWKASQFFQSTGVADPDSETFRPKWDCVGDRGRCRLKVETYEKDGETREKNTVDRYLLPTSDEAEEEVDNITF